MAITDPIRKLIAGALLTLCIGCSHNDVAEVQTAAPVESNRPNIVFIMSDDHALRALSAYGDSIIDTPNIDRLANEGVLFRNAFVTNSICSPSRAVLLTGKYSHQNGLRDNRDEFDGSQQTFPKILQRAGYETAVIGKWHLKSAPTGFDHWEVLIGQGEYYSPHFRSSDGVVRYDGAYVTDKVTDLAVDYLENRGSSKPFFMLYSHKAPHRNWMPWVDDLGQNFVGELEPPDTFSDSFDRRPAAAEADMRVRDMFLSWDMKLQPDEYPKETGIGGGGGRDGVNEEVAQMWQDAYLGMTPEQRAKWDSFYSSKNAEYLTVKDDPAALSRWMFERYLHDYGGTIRALDRNVGRLVEYLETKGLLENTIIVYTSDQGFYLGEHGWYDKRFMYEESMRTPLIIRTPESQQYGGRSVEQLVQNIDYAPTLLDIAGIKAPADMAGASLVPLVAGDKPTAWRDSLYYHYYEFPHGWHRVRPHYGVRTERYKLIHFYGDLDYWELYDLQTDPKELNNLYADESFSAIRAELHRKLNALREKNGDAQIALN